MTPQPDTAAPARRGRRQDAEANRDRILHTAHTVLAANPEASMDDLAHAAGVVRRTIYAHFPNRDALIAGLADQAMAEVTAALGRTDRSGLPPEVALAEFVLTLWQTGDRYRLLMSLGERSLGSSGIRDLLTPVNAQALDLLARGREAGRFATHLPLEVLGASLLATTLALLQAVNDQLWTDDGTRTATAVLLTAGLPAAATAPAIERARAVQASAGLH